MMMQDCGSITFWPLQLLAWVHAEEIDSIDSIGNMWYLLHVREERVNRLNSRPTQFNRKICIYIIVIVTFIAESTGGPVHS